MDVHSQLFSDYIVSGDVVLNPQSTHKSFDLQLKDKVEDFDLRVKYSGEGYLGIDCIKITKNTVGIRKNAFLACMAVLLFTVYYLLRRKIEQNKRTLFLLAAITFLSCVPVMTQGMCTGHDGAFHLLRIEGLAEELKLGTFPVRMQSIWMGGYGYPVSIYYGDILLYIPAILRIIGFSVSQSYKVYLFLINLGTTLITYICFNNMIKDSKAAFFGTAGYVFAIYRLTNVYVRVAVGEYTAMMFLPLVLLALYRIYTEDAADFKKYMKNAVLLAAAMTGLVQTHLISVVTVSLTIAVVCILMIKKTLRKNTLIVYASAILMTVLFNLFFFVPLMDYSKNVSVQVLNYNNAAAAEVIQGKGAYISQYFMFYQKVSGGSGTSISDRMAITPGIVLMTALFLGFYFCIKNQDRFMQFMTLMSVLLLWMASDLFPWNFIIKHVPFMEWLEKIQFPWRFLPIAQLLLALLLCMLLAKIRQEKRERAELGLFILLIVTTGQMFSGVIQEGNYAQQYDTAGIDSFSVGNGEYVRADTNTDYFNGVTHTNNVRIIEGYTRQGKNAIIKCEAEDEGDNAWVEFPLMHYKNYAAYGDDRTAFTIEDGDNNTVRVMIPKGYKGTVSVVYEIPVFYKMADMCSFITVLAAALFAFANIGKRRKKRILN